MKQADYQRARHLLWRMEMLHHVFGEGPWLDAARGRLDAVTGATTAHPWWWGPNVPVPNVVAWHRESGHKGYMNRAWRKHKGRARGAALKPLHNMRKALRHVTALATTKGA